MEGTPKQPDQPRQPTPGHDANPHDRIDGLRTWIGQLERKLNVRTWLALAVGAVALAAAIVAIVLVQGTKEDSATDADVQNLREELTGVEQTAAQAAEEDVRSLSSRLSTLEDQVSKLQGDQRTTDDELSVVKDDIDDLRTEISDLDAGSSSTSGE
jgi:septal ring factor EnvC (AmiA/AmiB activator)